MSARIERLIRIYNRLRRGPVTIEIMSKWAKTAGIQVSDRQLYRDLNTLKSLQIAEGENVIEFIDEKNRKTWKLEYDDKGEKVSQYDINSFYLLMNFAPQGIIDQRRSSIEKFEKIIYRELSKSKYQQYVNTYELYFRRTNYFGHMYGEIEHLQIEELIWALHNKRSIIIDSIGINPANVHLPNDPFPLTMNPLELVLHHGRIFICGLNEQNKLQIFSVDKDTKFHLTNKTFNRRKLLEDYERQMQVVFGISDPMNDTVYNIEVEFTGAYARSWMKYFWHASQKWVQLKNGNYMLHLHCSIGRELFGFLAYGLDKIKVHQPKILKDMLLDKFRRCVEIHENNLDIDEEEANKVY
jgi:predicted DNA-binding transcriptional regulator YafY